MKRLYFLAILTLIFSLVSALTIYRGFFEVRISHLTVDESDIDRNENSTPRSFILPATPAVVEAQESKKKLLKEGLNLDKCLLNLKDMGYSIDDINSAFNAKYIEAIINFQISKGLPATGNLDKLTIKYLGC